MAKHKDRASGRGRRRLGMGLQGLMSAPISIDLSTSTETAVVTPALEANTPEPVSAGSGAAPSIAPPPTEPDEQPPAVRMLDLGTITPSPHQPRRDFDEENLEHLARSIQSAGLMQPIVVRPATDGFEIVAGERRWRAAQRIGLLRIPAVVRVIDDRTAAEWSLVENLQREDLNTMERADAFQRLFDEFGLTHQEIAEQVGLDRSSVTNHLRLRELDPASQEALRHGKLTMGHGRALLAITNITDRDRLRQRTEKGGWSVRELERRIRAHPARPAAAGGAHAQEPSLRQAQVEDLERRLGAFLGTKVGLHPAKKKGAGTLVISFYSLDEFEGLMERLGFAIE